MVQNGLSLQQFKCLIQSPKCKHPPSSLAAKVASESSKVCRNLLSNCRHLHSPFGGGNGTAFHLICLLESPQCVHNCCFALTVEGGSSHAGALCPRGPVLLAGSCTLYSCVQAQKEALPKAQQVRSSRLSTQTHVSRELGFSTLASSIQERLSGLGVLLFVFG